jgi:hypothetical protein
MAFAAHLIINGQPAFDVFAKYYTMFPFDKSTTPSFIYKTLLPPLRVKNMTFERLLDTMISCLSGRPITDNFIIVTHGAYDHGGSFGRGLLIPLIDGSPLKATYDILQVLLDLVNKGRPTTELADWDYRYQNDDVNGGREVRVDPRHAQILVEKMRQLIMLKARIVELRACNLGTNPTGLEILGQCLGARFIVAPKQKMFAVGVNAAPGGVLTATQFDAHLKDTNLAGARIFTNPASSADRLAIKVTGSVSRSVDVMTTSKDLHWFTDKFIWTGGNYPPGTSRPGTFFMEGIDQVGGSFALPQEQAWCDSLYSSGVLPGNRI